MTDTGKSSALLLGKPNVVTPRVSPRSNGSASRWVAQVAGNLCAKHKSLFLQVAVSCHVVTLVASNQSYPKHGFETLRLS